MTDPGVQEAGRQSGTFHTTRSVPAHRRRTYWREVLSQTFGAVDISVPEEVYSGTVRTSPLGRVRGVTVDGDPMQTLRTRRLVAGNADDDHVVVMLLSRGVGRIEQDTRDAYVGPGELFVYDRARPLRLTFPESFQTKSLVLPRDVLGLTESDLRQITASPLASETPLGELLSPFPARLVDTAGTYPQHTAEVVARNVVDLLAGRRGARASYARGAVRRLLVERGDPPLRAFASATTVRVVARWLRRWLSANPARRTGVASGVRVRGPWRWVGRCFRRPSRRPLSVWRAGASVGGRVGVRVRSTGPCLRRPLSANPAQGAGRWLPRPGRAATPCGPVRSRCRCRASADKPALLRSLT
jgi:hypothetical protein